MSKNKALGFLAAFALILVTVLAVVAAQPATPAKAAYTAGSAITLQSRAAKTATFQTTGRWVGSYERCGIHSNVDVSSVAATEFQTVTLALQFSPDNTNWYNYATAVHTTISADATAAVDVPCIGQYIRGNYTLGAANNVTLTLVVVAK